MKKRARLEKERDEVLRRDLYRDEDTLRKLRDHYLDLASQLLMQADRVNEMLATYEKEHDI